MSPSTEENEAVRIVRNIQAPVGRVYDAFTVPDQLLRWMGPEGWRATRAEVDLRIGGSCDIWVAKEDGEAGSFHWEFVEIDPKRRLVFSFAFGGPGEEVDGHRSRMSLEFKETGPGTTELTLVHDRLGAASPDRRDVHTGWTQATTKLVAYLEAGDAGAAS